MTSIKELTITIRGKPLDFLDITPEEIEKARAIIAEIEESRLNSITLSAMGGITGVLGHINSRCIVIPYGYCTPSRQPITGYNVTNEFAELERVPVEIPLTEEEG